MATIQRTPFAELSSGRLQQLASVKNRQNAFVIAQDVKPNVTSSQKRSFAMTSLDDSENVDPGLSKKNKLETSKFELTPLKPMSLKTTPEHRETFSPPRAPLSAPAGRSPKRKSIGLPKPRRLGFTRIDPPMSRSIGLPFSLDEALNNCVPKVKPVPSKWKFDIYVDTPEEEAATLMEHSTLTLDLSSDDESRKQEKEDLGKENIAPEGHVAPLRPSRGEGKPEIIRQKVADAMDDGERSPLSDLEVEPFNTVPAGEATFIVVEPETEAEPADAAAPTATVPKEFTFTSPVPPARLTETKAEDIKIFEDETVAVADTIVESVAVADVTTPAAEAVL